MLSEKSIFLCDSISSLLETCVVLAKYLFLDP